MNYREILKAEQTLADRIERSETMATDTGSYCLSVQFHGGHSRIFYTLDSVMYCQQEYEQRQQHTL